MWFSFVNTQNMCMEMVIWDSDSSMSAGMVSVSILTE